MCVGERLNFSWLFEILIPHFVSPFLSLSPRFILCFPFLSRFLLCFLFLVFVLVFILILVFLLTRLLTPEPEPEPKPKPNPDPDAQPKLSLTRETTTSSYGEKGERGGKSHQKFS
jgi:hypothetical protein